MEHFYKQYDRQDSPDIERIYTNELTDASERLHAPMYNSFEYEFDPDQKALYFQGVSIVEYLDRGLIEARELEQQNPDFKLEADRRLIERQEYEEQLKLAQGNDSDPDVLVVVSPIPDAIRDGKAKSQAYDTDRQKTLVRVYQRTDTGLRALSFSLDKSDYKGLQAAVQAIGGELPDGLTSEEILNLRFHLHQSEFDRPVASVFRMAYDAELTKLYGGAWYAGRQDETEQDSLSFISHPAQADLVREHMQRISPLIAAYGPQDARLEALRYDFAAALARRRRGDSEVWSLAAAGDQARANGETYKSDCPTSAQQPEQALQEMGILRCVTCPYCGYVVDAIVGQSGALSCPRKQCSAYRQQKNQDGRSSNKQPQSRTTDNNSAGFSVIPLFNQNKPKTKGTNKTKEILVIGGTREIPIDDTLSVAA